MKKVALITGSTSGIGLGIAASLAKEGFSLVINGLHTTPEVEALRLGWEEKYKIKTEFIGADLSQLGGCDLLAREALKVFGRVDVLVNNAGVQYVAPIEEMPYDKWELVVGTNLRAPYALIHNLLGQMRQNGWGRIINIASAHGLVASKSKAAYVSAKHGLFGLTKVVALETADTSITCNAICPGWVLTPLVERQIRDRAQASGRTFEEEKRDLLLEKQPSGEFATVDQIGSLVAFLCSEGAAQMRGSILSIDGGWVSQ